MPILLATSPLAAIRSAAGDDGLDAALAHHGRGHAVADQGYVNAPLFQLPRGQPRALQQRAGFAGIDVQGLARFGRREEDGQCRAVVGGGQSTGVAVGQNALPVAEQRGAVAADRAAHLPVFFVDGPGLSQEPCGNLVSRLAAKPRGRSLHPVQRPEQVDRRRAAGCKIVGDLFEPLPQGACVAHNVLDPEADTIGGGDADGRRTSDAQRLDGFPDGLNIAAVDFDQLGRQPRLVDQPQVAIDVADPT